MSNASSLGSNGNLRLLSFQLAQTLFSTLLVLTLLVFIAVSVQQYRIHRFSQQGVVAEATVDTILVADHHRYVIYTAEVQFFTEGGATQGQRITASISNLLNKVTADSLQEKENVVYLPGNPNKVVLQKSLQPQYWSRYQKWETVVYFVIATVIRFLMMRVLRKRM